MSKNTNALNATSIFWPLVGLLLLALMWLLLPILTPFIAGALFAFLFDPWTEKLNHWGLSRSWAAFIPVAVVIAVLLILLGIGLPLLVQEVSQFAQKIPVLAQQLQQQHQPWLLEQTNPYLGNIDIPSLLSTHGGKAAGIATNVLTQLVNSTSTALNVLSTLLLMPMVMFFILLDWPHILTATQKLIPRKYEKKATKITRHCAQALSGFLRGQLTVCVLLGLLYGICLWAVGLKLGFALGMVTGLLAFVPVIGGLIGMVAIIGVALLQFQFTAVEPYLFIAAILALGSILESFFLTPVFVGNRINLHPVWIIFALMAGSQLGGFVGILLAMPLAAILRVLIPEAIDFWQKSKAYKGKA